MACVEMCYISMMPTEKIKLIVNSSCSKTPVRTSYFSREVKIVNYVIFVVLYL